MRRSLITITSFVLVGISPAALAHPGHPVGGSFTTGLLHPFTGLDHLLAMIAVGLWAAQRGGRSQFVIPTSFVAMMVLGAMIGASSQVFPLVEPGVLGSLVVFGLLIALDARLPLASSMVIVGAFAMFHGYAHAIEMPSNASLAVFGSGMVLGSVALIFVGIGTGRLGQVRIRNFVSRGTGSLIALTGIALFTLV